MLNTVIEDFSMEATTQGMTNLNTLLSYTYPICYNCYVGLSETLNPSSYSTIFTASNILENLLFNAGYIYSAVINIALNDPSTVSNWPYFMAYNAGNVLVHFFYRANVDDEDI